MTFLPALRSAKLNWTKAGKIKLRRAWRKRSSAIDERKKKKVKKYQRPVSQSYNLGEIFAKLREKIARLEQKRLEKGARNMESLIQTEVISISSACLPPLIFQDQQKEMHAISLVNLKKLFSLVTEQDKIYSYILCPQSNFFQKHVIVK